MNLFFIAGKCAVRIENNQSLQERAVKQKVLEQDEACTKCLYQQDGKTVILLPKDV